MEKELLMRIERAQQMIEGKDEQNYFDYIMMDLLTDMKEYITEHSDDR